MADLTDTGDIRQKMIDLWQKMENGKLSHAEARVHIGFARTVLDTLKVEIAAAHLDAGIPRIPLQKPAIKSLNGKRAHG